MATATEDARARLGAIADVVLTHDRPIVRPVDDSIVRLTADGVQVLRRARGFAPLPVELHVEGDRAPTILAVGGHLKNTVAILLGGGQASRVGNAHSTQLGRVRETHHEEPQSVRCTYPAQVVMSARGRPRQRAEHGGVSPGG